MSHEKSTGWLLMMFCESCNAMINTQYTPTITTLSPDACSQQLYVVFANSTACSFVCNRMWLNTKVGIAAVSSMNDLHYTRCGMESLAIQMDVTAVCRGFFYKVHQELEGPSPVAICKVVWFVGAVVCHKLLQHAMVRKYQGAQHLP